MNRKVYSISLDQTTYEDMQAEAIQRGLKFSQFVKYMWDEYQKTDHDEPEDS